MTPERFAMSFTGLSPEKQEDCLNRLRCVLTEEEYNATTQYLNWMRLYRNPAKYNALKKAVKDMLCEEFYGHPAEEPETKGFDPCNPVYMTTIL